MRGAALSIVLLILCAIPSYPDGALQNGFVNTDGYTWRDGLWWWQDRAYTRESVPYTAYRSYTYGYNSYQQPYTAYRYQYYEVTPPVAKIQPLKLPPPTDTQWRSKLLEIQKARTEIDGSMRLEALNNQLYLDSIQALGLEREFAMQNYGRTMQYPYTQVKETTNYQLGTYGVQGQTIYGHTRSTMAELYGAVDPSLLYQQSSALTKNAQDWGGRAHDNFTDLVLQDAQGRARVAEIYAKGKAAAEALSAAEGNSSRTFKQETVTTVKPSVQGSVQPVMPYAENGNGSSNGKSLNNRQALEQIITNRCISCHGPEAKEGNLDMRGYFEFNEELKERVWQRLTTNDEEKRMPRNADGTPGERLPNAEIKMFLLH